MTSISQKILHKFYAEVEEKLVERLTAMLGHEPGEEELRGRCRKEVSCYGGLDREVYYLDGEAFLWTLVPVLEKREGSGELFWWWRVMTSLPGVVEESRRSERGRRPLHGVREIFSEER